LQGSKNDLLRIEKNRKMKYMEVNMIN